MSDQSKADSNVEVPAESSADTTAKTTAQSKVEAHGESSVEPQTTAPKSTPIAQQAAPVVVKSGRGLAVFAILLSLLALAGAGFTFYQTQIIAPQQESRLAVGVAEIGGQVSRLGDHIQRLQVAQDDVVASAVLDAKLAEAVSNTDVKIRNIRDSQQEVTNIVTKLSDDLARGTKEYAISEVAQLLKQANHSVNFAKDPAAAINALKLADAQLKELADPRYSAIRQRVNEEIASLQAVRVVDVEQITGQLRGLESTIPSLPLENDTPVLGEVEVASVEGETGIRAGLRAMWKDLVAILQPQRIDQAPKALLAPEQRYFLDQNIQLQLTKAQLSVLQNRQSEYRASLSSAGDWLRGYFDLRDQEVTKALAKLDELSKLELASELPTIAGSYDELQKVSGGQ